MKKRSLFMMTGLAAALLLAACGGSDNGREAAFQIVSTSSDEGGFAVGAPAIEPSPPPADFGFDGDFDDAFEEQAFAQAADQAARAPSPQPASPGGTTPSTQVADRQVISTGSIGISVEAVRAASSQVEEIADGLGGFVEQLNVFGDDEFASAEITLRVPQAEFSTAFERLRRLGDVQFENVSQQDVTEQFIDLEARLNSSTREEQSLLRLLDQTNSISDIITIERELTRIRSEIERLQGQLNFIERRVDFSTISVSLFAPEVPFTEPPSASVQLEVSNVTRAVDDIRELVDSFDGVLDRVVINIFEDEESASVGFRVARSDFAAALAAVEGRGDVFGKQLREGEDSFQAQSNIPDEPDANIDLFLLQGEGGTDAGIIAAIVVPSVVGGLLLLGGLVVWQRRRMTETAD